MYEDFIGNFPEDQASPLEEKKQGNREAGVSADHYSQANTRSSWTANSGGHYWNKWYNMHTISGLLLLLCLFLYYVTHKRNEKMLFIVVYIFIYYLFHSCQKDL